MRQWTRLLSALLVSGWVALAPVLVAAQVSWSARTGLSRLEVRFETETSGHERARLAERLAHLGPPEAAARVLGPLLAAELEPEVRTALLLAATRLAVLDRDGVVSSLQDLSLERYAAASPSERSLWARLLGVLETPAALDALLSRIEEESARQALITAGVLGRWRRTEASLARGWEATPIEPTPIEPTPIEPTQLTHAQAALLARVLDDPEHSLLELGVLGTLPDEAIGQRLAALLGTGSPALDAALAEVLAAHAAASPAFAETARRALLSRIESSSDALVLRACLRALADFANPGDAEIQSVSLAHRADPDSEVAAAALSTLLRVAPGEAARQVAGDPAALRRLLADSDAPELVAFAAPLLTIDPDDAAILDFLARARGGAGIEVLLAEGAAPGVLAIALRRADGSAPCCGDGPSEILWRAIARMPVSFDGFPTGATEQRLVSAMAMAMAQRAPSFDPTNALEAETSAETRAWMLEAARRHHLSIDAQWLRRAMAQGRDELASLVLLIPTAHGGAADLRWLRRALSQALLDDAPSVRANAAWALAEFGATSSSAAVEALLEDPQPMVRVAAGLALRRLAPERARWIEARATIDSDPRVVRLLAATMDPPTDVLVLDTERHGTDPEQTLWLEVQTDDGLVRTLPTAPDGSFVLVDVPGASAEVRVVLR